MKFNSTVRLKLYVCKPTSAPSSQILIFFCQKVLLAAMDHPFQGGELKTVTIYRGVRTNYFTMALLYFGNFFGLQMGFQNYFGHLKLSDLI